MIDYSQIRVFRITWPVYVLISDNIPERVGLQDGDTDTVTMED